MEGCAQRLRTSRGQSYGVTSMRDQVYVFHANGTFHGIYYYPYAARDLNKEFKNHPPPLVSYNSFNGLWSCYTDSWRNLPLGDVPPEISAQLVLLGVTQLKNTHPHNPFKRVKQ